MKKNMLFIASSLMVGLAFAEVLPARYLNVPCETEQIAVDIISGEASVDSSQWVKDVSDSWTQVICGRSMTFSRPWRWYLRRTVLRFEGVSSAFEVFVNGKSAGNGEADGLPWEFDISSLLLKRGENKLEVKTEAASADFRRILLISESPNAPKNFVVESSFDKAGGKGHFIIRDEKGNILKEREVPEVKTWTIEKPYLYVTPMEVKRPWYNLFGTDYYTVAIGFRDPSVKTDDSKAVQKSGFRSIDVDEIRELKQLKAKQHETVLAGPIPPSPEWFEYCDTLGMLTILSPDAKNGKRRDAFYGSHPSYFVKGGK